MKGFTNNKNLIAFGLALFVVIALWLAVPLTAWTYINSWTLDSTGTETNDFTIGDDVTIVVNLTKNTEDILRGSSIEIDRPSGSNIDIMVSYCELYDSSDNLLDNVTYDSSGDYDTVDYGYAYGYGFNYYGYGYGYWYGAPYSGTNTYILCYYTVAGSDNSYEGTYTYDVYLGINISSRTLLEADAGGYTMTAAAAGVYTPSGGARPVNQPTPEEEIEEEETEDETKDKEDETPVPPKPKDEDKPIDTPAPYIPPAQEEQDSKEEKGDSTIIIGVAILLLAGIIYWWMTAKAGKKGLFKHK